MVLLYAGRKGNTTSTQSYGSPAPKKKNRRGWLLAGLVVFLVGLVVLIRGSMDRRAMSFEQTSRAGRVGGGKIPAWIPQYPGSRPKSIFYAATAEGKGGSYIFTTPDPIGRVVKFYEDGLRAGGFEIKSNVNSDPRPGGMITIDSGPKMATVILNSEDDKTSVNVTFTDKTDR